MQAKCSFQMYIYNSLQVENKIPSFISLDNSSHVSTIPFSPLHPLPSQHGQSGIVSLTFLISLGNQNGFGCKVEFQDTFIIYDVFSCLGRFSAILALKFAKRAKISKDFLVARKVNIVIKKR